MDATIPSVPVLVPGRHNQGVSRRRIILDATNGMVRAALEDDFHHFEVDLFHDGARVLEVEGRARRTPWTTCPSARAVLQRLVGAELGPEILRRSGLPDPLQQCTHMFDLALLAIAQAVRGGRRQYDTSVLDRIGRTLFPELDAEGRSIVPQHPDGCTRAELRRDGELLLCWDIESDKITGPAPFDGVEIRRLTRWGEGRLDDDGFEALRVLQRALLVSGGRVNRHDELPSAAYIPAGLGSCLIQQPDNAAAALRVRRSSRDFTHHSEALLSDFDDAGPWVEESD